MGSGLIAVMIKYVVNSDFNRSLGPGNAAPLFLLVKRKARQMGKREVKKRKQLQGEQQLLTITYGGLGSGSDRAALQLGSSSKVKCASETESLAFIG